MDILCSINLNAVDVFIFIHYPGQTAEGDITALMLTSTCLVSVPPSQHHSSPGYPLSAAAPQAHSTTNSSSAFIFHPHTSSKSNLMSTVLA